MYRNSVFNDGISIFAVSRNKEKISACFKDYFDSKYFIFVQQDIQTPLQINDSVDYIIHCASYCHPIAFSTEPINIILTSVLGTKSVLDFACQKNVKRTIFLSSSEIYGENRGDTKAFNEQYCGNLDCNTLRACYPEGKRAAETLCQAYIRERNIDVVIARPCHVYGPSFGDYDSKVIAQFIRNAVNGEKITLKSKGDQEFSYCYSGDICSALIILLLKGERGQAYNISDDSGHLSLLQIAEILSQHAGTEIFFDTPSITESSGYSRQVKALVDSSKLQKLGWKPGYPVKDGIKRTVDILRYN
jgi:nucleoside-diphosphate-sugar epimerase